MQVMKWYDDMKCVFVCNEKWSLSPGSLLLPLIISLYNSRLVIMVFKIPDWFFMVPSMSACIGFQGLRLVFHGSRSVFMVFKVPGWFSWFQVKFYVFSRFQVGFHGSRLNFMFFQGSRLVFMVPGQILCFFKVPGWFSRFQMGIYGYSKFQICFSWFLWFQVGLLWFQVCLYLSWAPEARSETLRTPKKILAWFVSWPHDPARPCRP